MSIEQVVDDWTTVKRRWEAWWECELYDRVLLQITARREGVVPAQLPDVDTETKWTSVEYMIRRTLEAVRTTYYGGDAVPIFLHSWAAGHTLYFGCEPHFKDDTVWVDPAPIGEDGYPLFDGWRENRWHRWMLDSTEAATRASKGRYFPRPMWGNHAGDNLALVRGTEKLLVDIVASPGWVKRAVQTLSDIQIEVFEEIRTIESPEISGVEGSVNYASCWSPSKTLAFDCDVSCMISADAFKELFLPPLVETMHTVDHRIYHLDGPGALHHLDALLDLPELQAIQWVPGAGGGGIMEWIPLVERIQAAGKAVQVSVSPDQVEPLLGMVRPEGLLIHTGCKTEGEARRLVDRVSSLF